MISLVSLMHDGKVVETCIVGFDNAVGIGAALSGRRSNCRAVVQLPLTSQRISTANFKLAYANSSCIRAMANHANELMIEQAQQCVACNALHEADARLARWLLRCADYAEVDQLPLTQGFMAEMLGLRRTTVTNIACALHEKGLIDYSRGQLTVIDRAGLEKTACECYAALAKGLNTVRRFPNAHARDKGSGMAASRHALFPSPNLRR